MDLYNLAHASDLAGAHPPDEIETSLKVTYIQLEDLVSARDLLHPDHFPIHIQQLNGPVMARHGTQIHIQNALCRIGINVHAFHR